MAFRKIAALPLHFSRVPAQQIHTTSRTGSLKGWLKNFFENKPMPTEGALAVGYERIVIEAAKVGEDPLEVFNRDEKFLPEGAGTKVDPYIIPSRNTRRCVMVQGEGKTGPPQCFWVTLEYGGRCPLTGDHFKLDYDPTDKWGIDELDLFKH